MHILDELAARGLLKDVTDPDGLRARMDAGPITFYCGYDPTSTSLTLGNAVPLMLQAHIQRAGHKPIVLMGGATGLVGDPTGKDKVRAQLGHEQMRANMAGQRPVYGRVLDFEGENAATLVNNLDWFAGIGYLEFLRDVGRHISVNEMLQVETYARRLREQQHLSFLEFNYRLLQGYDFLHLFRDKSCELQVGGSDQWGNCVAGTELIRKTLPGSKAWVLTCPLLLTADGKKMGKTESGAVYLTADRTSPYDLYQYCVNVPDAEVGKMLRTFTFMPLDEIAALEALPGKEINRAKVRLGKEIVTMFHGADEAEKARVASEALFSGGAKTADVPTVSLARDLFVGEGIALNKLLLAAGLQGSGKQAKNLVLQGGGYVNDEKQSDPFRKLTEADLDDEGSILLRAGKKKYCRVVTT
jgi:tyrosyl-tRNA synthetase